MVKILIAEDDPGLNRILCGYLSARGFETIGVPDGQAALDALESSKFDMVISDVMMPRLDGFGLAQAIRATDRNIPILFVSARDDMSAKQRGFDGGIDEYIVKPFDLDELHLRVKAILRRAHIYADRKLIAGNFTMDQDEHTAYRDNEPLDLTVREFDILYQLLSYPKRAFTRSQLMEAFWDFDSSATSRTVDVYMAKLREKTADCTGFELVTVHGLGYKAVLR